MIKSTYTNTYKMNSLVVQQQHQSQVSQQMTYQIIDYLLVLFISSGFVFYINNRLSDISKVFERHEARAQITDKQVNNVLELCERLIVQNIGTYDRSEEFARSMTAKFENMTEQISTIPGTFDKMLSANTSSLKSSISAANRSIEEIHAVRALDNIEQGVYQSWSGSGVYFEDGCFKFTTEISIVNKHLKTYRENKMWMDGMENDTSIAYRDMLMERISVPGNCFHIPNDFVRKTFNNHTHVRPYNAHINCIKYDWNGSIEIDITITEVYNNNNQRPQDAFNSTLSNATIDWKKSLVPA